MKTVKAVAPYRHPAFLNYKMSAYEAWERTGGEISPAHYPPRWLHGLAFRYEIPEWVQKGSCAPVGAQASKLGSSRFASLSKFKSLCWSRFFNCQFSIVNSHNEARLRFVQPWTIEFDTFPDYALYEVIPFFWDVWPENFEKTFAWLKRHEVKTAIFTSSQVAEMVKTKFPVMNVLSVTEGIDVETYSEGKQLKDREIDFLEYGRNIDSVVKYGFED